MKPSHFSVYPKAQDRRCADGRSLRLTSAAARALGKIGDTRPVELLSEVNQVILDVRSRELGDLLPSLWVGCFNRREKLAI